uniref:BUB1 mitotic checkpoint serine/threonine kinase B n=1 Tax=Lepisosteus oculatus TaxID=7918 RepID=W5N5A7_LEPOC
MAEESPEWELCKENIQPLKQGRSMSALLQALASQEGGHSAAIEQEKQAFESEIRFYEGDDPLDVWERYIKWTQQMYPQGGKASNFSTLLERAVMRFKDEKKYFNDVRYVNLWIKFAGICDEPLDLYSYMHAQGIGIMTAVFYISWSEEYEKHGNLKRAEAVYQDGLRCRAEPFDKLQYHHKNFNSRVIHKVVADMANGEEEAESPEPSQPQRASLADLKPRGHKKAIVPVERIGAAASYRGGGLNLQAPTLKSVQQNHRLTVFDENQAGIVESSNFKPEPWLAPPEARAKENDPKPEKWNGVKKKSVSSYSTEVPPCKPNFQPFVEESDQLPAVTPCKIDPSVNNVLSARKPAKEETPLQRLQVQQPGDGEKKEQSTYCKELLYSGATEFCFEELRAERYRIKKAKEMEEEVAKLARRKEELRREIEEKERLLQEASVNSLSCFPKQVRNIFRRSHQITFKFQKLSLIRCLWTSQEHLWTDQCIPSPVDLLALGCSTDDVFTSPSVKDDLQFEAMFLKSCNDGSRLENVPVNKPLSEFLPFTILEEKPISESLQKPAPVNASKPTVRKPLAAILKPLGNPPPKEAADDCDELEGIEPLNEEAIVDSYRNKTLCPVPDDTCDFLRAAHLASTPFSGGLGQRTSSGSENTLSKDLSNVNSETPKSVITAVKDPAFEEPLMVNKLSPIPEASLEDTRSTASSASSTSSSIGGQSGMKDMSLPRKWELSQSLCVNTVTEQEDRPQTAGKALTSTQVKQLLEKFTMGSIPNLHMELGSLPQLEEYCVLPLGDDTYEIKREMVCHENYKMFSGSSCLDNDDDKVIIVKVDFHPVPWDFYINMQLKKRLGADFPRYFNDLCSCYMYEEGCVTLNEGVYSRTLLDVLETATLCTNVAAFLTVNLLELIEQMHSCHLVHGNVRPDTLLLKDAAICQNFLAEGGTPLKVVDFTHSLDLDLQPEVTSVRGLQNAQPFLKQGLLSETSSPYQLDLLGIADTVHMMLEGKNMQVIKENSEWKLIFFVNKNVSINVNRGIWQDFFRKILNPGSKPTVSILSELRQEMCKENFLKDIEKELAFLI